MKLIYDTSVPAEVERALKPIVARWLFLVPSWCHELTMMWGPLDDDAFAEMACNIECRDASITIDPKWLEEDAEAREKWVRHELIHLILEPMVGFVEDMLTRVVDTSSVFHSWTKDEWRQRFEGAVVDLAKAVGDAHGRPRPR